MAQTDDYDFDYRLPGDSFLSLNLGTQVPLFNVDPNGTFKPSNLSLGGILGFELDWHLSNNLRLGVALKGLLAFTPNARQLYMVPMTAKVTYLFKSFPFSIPVSFGVGTVISSFTDTLRWDAILTPSVGFNWNYSSRWGFGLQITPWIIPQIYGADRSNETRVGTMMEISLSAIYNIK